MENVTDAEIKTIGMKCLVDALGSVGAERFIFIMNKDSSDYTEWRRSVFDDMSAEEISSGAKRYMKDHPLDDYFKGRLKSTI